MAEPAVSDAVYGPYADAVRTLQDRLAGLVVDSDRIVALTQRLHGLIAELEPDQRPEPQRLDGIRPHLPGRALLVLPPFEVHRVDPRTVRGTVRFGRQHLGGNGAVHGGSMGLLFDDLLGILASTYVGTISRTAYLHINYRRITPIGQVLHVEASVERVEGRKAFMSGRLTDADGALLCDAEGLFVALLPGQP